MVPDVVPGGFVSVVFLAESVEQFVQAGTVKGFVFSFLLDLVRFGFYWIFVDQRQTGALLDSVVTRFGFIVGQSLAGPSSCREAERFFTFPDDRYFRCDLAGIATDSRHQTVSLAAKPPAMVGDSHHFDWRWRNRIDCQNAIDITVSCGDERAHGVDSEFSRFFQFDRQRF